MWRRPIAALSCEKSGDRTQTGATVLERAIPRNSTRRHERIVLGYEEIAWNRLIVWKRWNSISGMHRFAIESRSGLGKSQMLAKPRCAALGIVPVELHCRRDHDASHWALRVSNPRPSGCKAVFYLFVVSPKSLKNTWPT